MKTLLDFLTYHNKLDDFVTLLDELEDGYKVLEDYKQNPSGYDTEAIELLKTDLEDFEETLADYKARYKQENSEANWAEEVENVKSRG